MTRLIVQRTLPGFGKVLAKDPPACYEPASHNYIVVNVTLEYARLFSISLGDEVCYQRYEDGQYWTVDPGTNGT